MEKILIKIQNKEPTVCSHFKRYRNLLIVLIAVTKPKNDFSGIRLKKSQKTLRATTYVFPNSPELKSKRRHEKRGRR